MKYSYILTSYTERQFHTLTEYWFISDSIEELKNYLESLNAEFVLEEADILTYRHENTWYRIRKVQKI